MDVKSVVFLIDCTRHDCNDSKMKPIQFSIGVSIYPLAEKPPYISLKTNRFYQIPANSMVRIKKKHVSYIKNVQAQEFKIKVKN